MATTYTFAEASVRNPQFEGQLKVTRGNMTLTGTYTAAGGFAVTASDFKLSQIYEMDPVIFVNGTDAVIGVFDKTNSKLIIIWGNAGTASVLPEASGSPDLGSYVGRVEVRGI